VPPELGFLDKCIERNHVRAFIAGGLGSGAARQRERFGAAGLQQCLSYVPLGEGGDNRLGPNLYKIVGRKAGSLPDYAFSNAMKQADFVWDEEKLDHFIAKPDEVVPGNNMKPYGGLASSDDRKKIIAFLARQQ
jgi:cytochrome c2